MAHDPKDSARPARKICHGGRCCRAPFAFFFGGDCCRGNDDFDMVVGTSSSSFTEESFRSGTPAVSTYFSCVCSTTASSSGEETSALAAVARPLVLLSSPPPAEDDTFRSDDVDVSPETPSMIVLLILLVLGGRELFEFSLDDVVLSKYAVRLRRISSSKLAW